MCYTYSEKLGGVCGTYWSRERYIQGFGGKTSGKDNLEDLDVNGKVILKWIIKKWTGEAWTGLNWLRIWTGGGRL